LVVPVKSGWVPVADAKRQVVTLIGQGLSVREAMLRVRPGSKDPEKAYANWRYQDKGFGAEVDRVREARSLGKLSREQAVGSFEDFRLRFLGLPTYPHQRMWVDALEGRDPELHHPSVVWEPANRRRLLVNTPPGHSKSMTVTIDYITYRVVKDPNIKVIIVSKTQKMAQQFLYAIKSRLTHPRYLDMQVAFGPADGWKAGADKWTATEIYLGGESRDSGEKDPTIQALGIGGQIYGARADLVIMDDCVTLGNAAEWEKQMLWLNIEVASRVPPTGQLVVIGTRVAPVDLYQQLRNPDHYATGKPPWSLLSQPAVLDYGDGEPGSWVTLWPRASVPFDGDDEPAGEDGLFRRWDGPHLAQIRDSVGPRIWSMVYQQQDTSEDAVFHPVAVRGSVNGMRKPGPLIDGAAGHPRSPEGFRVVCGLDPAMAGDTAAVAVAVDQATGRRFVLDVHVMSAPTPERIQQLVMEWTDRFHPQVWVVESNAFQLYLVHEKQLNDYVRSRGCEIRGHYTSRINKHDEDFGVAAMAPLFGNIRVSENENRVKHHDGNNLIELPLQTPMVKMLVEQLISWAPKTRNKTDAVMALWFPLDVDTDVPTPDGWSRLADLRAGDRVFAADGSATEVVAVTPRRVEPVFKVTLNDGTSLRATAEHRWWVTPKRYSHRLEPRWMTTAELADNEFSSVMIERPRPWDGPDVDLPVDPYVLGVWLGDGDSRQGTIFGHADDTPFVRGEFEMAGFPTTDQKRAMCFGTIGLRGRLAEAGVLGDKHVPAAYLRGSYKQRLALLQGLMDTDGTVLPGRARCYFANTNKRLVDAVVELVRSLGWRPNIQEVPAGPCKTPGGEGLAQKHWRVLFTAGADEPVPFRLPRKAERCERFVNRRPRNYMVVKSVEPDGEAEVACIVVEHGSHVFLAGRGMVPTGNCETVARDWVLRQDDSMSWYGSNPYASPRDVGRRQVVDIRDYQDALAAGYLRA